MGIFPSENGRNPPSIAGSLKPPFRLSNAFQIASHLSGKVTTWFQLRAKAFFFLPRVLGEAKNWCPHSSDIADEQRHFQWLILGHTR